MKRWFFIIPCLIPVSHLLAGPNVDQILFKADQVRNPQMDYTLDVTVTSYKPKREPKESMFQVLVKGRDKTVVITKTPAVDRGRILLMSDNNFWGYLPNVSKPLRISLQERLIGEVSNGDLARANFTGDYQPSLTGKKTINKKKYLTLDLKAKKEDVTYGRVVLYVDENNFRPHSAEFYSFSGRVLKTCWYEGYREFGGAVRPTKLTMKDALNQAQYSVLQYTKSKIAPLPDKYFTKDHMKIFAVE